MIRVELEASNQVSLSFSIISTLHCHTSKLEVNSSIVRRQLLHLIESLIGFIVELQISIGQPKLEVGIHSIFFDRHCRIKLLNRQFEILLVQILIGQFERLSKLAIGAAKAIHDLPP